jgi:hypothetical protein
VIRKALEEQARDEILRADIELQLDVVRLKGIHIERLAEVAAEEFARGACRFNGGFKISVHELWRVSGRILDEKKWEEK